MRYLLEICATVAEAAAVLARLPYHSPTTLTLADRGGEVLTAYLAPDRERRVPALPGRDQPPGRRRVDRARRGRRARSSARRASWRCSTIPATTAEAFVDAFLEPPLYSTDYSQGFGTLYTAVYNLPERTADYVWLGAAWSHSLQSFAPSTHVESLVEASVA